MIVNFNRPSVGVYCYLKNMASHFLDSYNNVVQEKYKLNEMKPLEFAIYVNSALLFEAAKDNILEKRRKGVFFRRYTHVCWADADTLLWQFLDDRVQLWTGIKNQWNVTLSWLFWHRFIYVGVILRYSPFFAGHFGKDFNCSFSFLSLWTGTQ